MGATDSKSQQDTAKLQGGADSGATGTGEESGNQTPLSDRRLVKLRDPRSPTDEVQRTPIIVPKPGSAATDDSFEDPRSPTVRIARTPIPDTDPRSPSVGVTRTPCPFTYPDPRSPTTNVARTPMLKESGSGRFDMPPVSENNKIEEEPQEEDSAEPEVDKDGEEGAEEEEGEAQNTSNNNSGDTVRLIDTSDPSGLPSDRLDADGSAEPNQTGGPAAEESTNETEDEDGQSQKLISSSKGPAKKSRKPSLTRSLRAKMHRSNSAPPRSPLSTRNLEKDASSVVHLRPAEGVITFGKEGSRRRPISGTPTRLVGKYELMVDKENF